MGACFAYRPGHARKDHRRVRQACRARRLLLGVAAGQRLQQTAGRRKIERAGVCRTGAGRAAQSDRHAHRLRRRRGTHRRLPEPGRGLWWRLAGSRPIAGRDPGARLRRPLLGLSGRRSAHRRLCSPRQDVRHHAGLLSAGRARLARSECPRASPKSFDLRPTPASSRPASSWTIRPRIDRRSSRCCGRS